MHRPFRLQQALSLNAGIRENLMNTSVFRLRSDGSCGCILSSFTNRRLSERRRNRTVFVTAFFILSILYHVRDKKSNVFILKSKNLFPVQFSILSMAKNWRNCLLTNECVCDLMTFVHILKTLTENLLFLKAPESRRSVRAGAEGLGGLLPESVL